MKEVSHVFKSTRSPVASPDGTHIATLNGSRFQIFSTASLELIRSIGVLPDACNRTCHIRWSPISTNDGTSSRALLADEDNCRVWDLHNEKWSAVISSGSGGMGKVVNADFGRTKDEVLLFSDFGSKATVWSLATGRTVEIKDPKFSTKGYGHRPVTGLFALLSRPAAQDTVTLHAPNTYFVLKTITLPSADAQGLKWSPDGQWLVAWDTPSTGYGVFVYTADGHLYRTYNGEATGGIEGLGVKSIEWSTRGDFLAIGGHDRRVTLLNTRTFSPTVYLDHTSTIQLSASDVWQEQAPATSARTYTMTPQPASPPTAPSNLSDPNSKRGISVIAFSTDGTLLATKDEFAPTTVWIWDLVRLTPRTVLIQHAPVKQLSWHPSLPGRLLIQCVQDEPVVYQWDASKDAPEVFRIPFEKRGGRSESRWLHTPSNRKPALLFSDAHNFVFVWPEGQDPVLQFQQSSGSPHSMDDSTDSLFDILTGKTPIPAAADTTVLEAEADFEDVTGIMEDTFVGRRHVGST